MGGSSGWTRSARKRKGMDGFARELPVSDSVIPRARSDVDSVTPKPALDADAGKRARSNSSNAFNYGMLIIPFTSCARDVSTRILESGKFNLIYIYRSEVSKSNDLRWEVLSGNGSSMD